MKPTVLIVDDEAGVRSALSGVLRDEGYEVEAVESGEACLDRVARAPYDVIVLDIWLPGMDGLVTLARLRERRVDAPVVMISGHGNIESAVRAIKLGAFDFVEKPLSLEKTVLVVGNAVRQRRLEAENRALRAHVDRRLTMVGESYAMAQLREQVAMAAPTNGRVLIYGENGTGKELVARSIHAMSRRRTGPFVEVNCAAIPEELIESELFGHVKGSFTGATADRRGKFELADGGTLFLDEIGDMSLKTQAKVLRALQEQVVEPVGGTAGVRVDVRVLAATNKDLPTEIRGGAVPRGPLLPPQRHSRSPCRRCATGRATSRCSREHFMAELAREYGRRPKRFDAGAATGASELPLAGQRPRAAERDRAADDHGAGRHDHRVGPEFPRRAALVPRCRRRQAPPMSLHEARERFERDYILRALAAQQGNISRPRMPSASSAAICIGRCARSASRRRAESEGEEEPAEH